MLHKVKQRGLSIELARIRQKQDTLEADLPKRFNKVQVNWRAMAEAWGDQETEPETTLDSLRLTKAEKAEKCLGEGDATTARLNEVVTALRRTFKV